MLKKEDLSSVKDIINDFTPRISAFEKNILLPQIIDRLHYLVNIMEKFKAIAEDDSVATHIDAALRKIVNENKYNIKLPEPQIGKQYLNSIKRICNEDYILPIRMFLSNNQLEKICEFKDVSEFLNQSQSFFQSIISSRDELFLYSLKSFLNLKNLKTGEVILEPPIELSLVLMPFSVKINEMIKVAESTIRSIDLWGEQANIQKQRHVEIITNVCQIKSSEFQVKAAKWNFTIQLIVFITAFISIIATYRVNQYLERRDLEIALIEAKSREALLKKEIGKLKKIKNKYVK